MFEAIRVIAALLLIFFLPGIMLVQALFPRRGELDPDFDWLYRIAMAIGLSIVITILVTFGLNSLGVNPDTGMGYVTAVPITVSLVLLTLLFFGISWYRGGLPVLAKLHPSFIRFPTRDPRDEDIPHLVDRKQRYIHQNLVERKFKLISQIDNAERMMEAHSGEKKAYYSKRRQDLLEELRQVEGEISHIEKGLPDIETEELEIDYMEVGQDE